MAVEIGTIKDEGGKLICRMWLVTAELRKRDFMPHSHREFEVSLVTRGKGVYCTEHSKYRFEKGCIFAFRSNEKHSITEITEEADLLSIQFEPERTDRFYGEFANMFDNCDKLKEILHFIRNEFYRADKHHEEMIKLKIRELMLTISRLRNLKRVPDSVAEIISFINSNYKSDITMKQLSEIAAISPNYLSKIFHTASGISIWNYITALRIDNAKKLLREDSGNIIDIAFESGYNNTANFNKAFKKQTGMTPREFRNSAKDKINIDI